MLVRHGGARNGELLRRTVHVRRVEIVRGQLRFDLPKGRKERDVPLPDSISCPDWPGASGNTRRLDVRGRPFTDFCRAKMGKPSQLAGRIREEWSRPHRRDRCPRYRHPLAQVFAAVQPSLPGLPLAHPAPDKLRQRIDRVDPVLLRRVSCGENCGQVTPAAARDPPDAVDLPVLVRAR